MADIECRIKYQSIYIYIYTLDRIPEYLSDTILDKFSAYTRDKMSYSVSEYMSDRMAGYAMVGITRSNSNLASEIHLVDIYIYTCIYIYIFPIDL